MASETRWFDDAWAFFNALPYSPDAVRAVFSDEFLPLIACAACRVDFAAFLGLHPPQACIYDRASYLFYLSTLRAYIYRKTWRYADVPMDALEHKENAEQALHALLRMAESASEQTVSPILARLCQLLGCGDSTTRILVRTVQECMAQYRAAASKNKRTQTCRRCSIASHLT